MRASRGLLTLTILLIGAACAAASSSEDNRYRSTLITWEEMQRRGQHSSLYTLIQELRPRWLRSLGPDTFLGQQGQVQVRMDGNPMGGVEALRRLSAYGVTSIQWVPPIDAAALYGLNHSHGAIVISTAPIH